MKHRHFHHNLKLLKLSAANKSVFVTIMIALGLSFTSFLLIYFYTIILTNNLGINTYGLYATITSVIFTVYLVLLIGRDQGVIAFIPDMVEKNDNSGISTYIKYSRRSTLWQFTLLVTISFIVLLCVYAFKFFPENAFTSTLSFLWLCPIGALLWYLGCYIEARNYPNSSLILSSVISSALLLLALLVCVYLHYKLNLFSAIFITFATTLIALIVTIIFCKKIHIFPVNTLTVPTQNTRRQWSKTNFDLYIISIITYVPPTIIVFLAQYFSNTKTAATVSVLVTISSIVFVVFSAISVVYEPKISTAVTDGDAKKVKSLLIQSILFTTILGALPTVAIIAFSKYWLGQFGHEYTDAYLALIIITIANYINIILTPFQYVTQFSCDLRNITWVAVVFILLFIGLSIWWDHAFDTIGAVLAYSILFVGFWFYLTALTIFTWKKIFMPKTGSSATN